MTRCSGSDVQADSTICPGCNREVDRYRQDFLGTPRFRFVEHSRQIAQPPAELVHAILNERSLFDTLEESLIRAALDVQQVVAQVGELVDSQECLALQMRAAVVAEYAQQLEEDLLRLRKSAA